MTTFTITLLTGESSENAGSFESEKSAKEAARNLLKELFPGEKIKSKPGLIYITDMASVEIKSEVPQEPQQEPQASQPQASQPESQPQVTEPQEEEVDRYVTLADANNPGARFRSSYPPAIKLADGSTFWGCDQYKLLQSLRLNAESLDGFSRRGNNFYIDSTRLWGTTKKSVADKAEQIARAYIVSLSGAEA